MGSWPGLVIWLWLGTGTKIQSRSVLMQYRAALLRPRPAPTEMYPTPANVHAIHDTMRGTGVIREGAAKSTPLATAAATALSAPWPIRVIPRPPRNPCTEPH